MRIELSRMIRRLGGNFADLCHNDDLELFQDIERARREEAHCLLDPLAAVSHVRCPDILWVSEHHLSSLARRIGRREKLFLALKVYGTSSHPYHLANK